jgi:hypothetical protein
LPPNKQPLLSFLKKILMETLPTGAEPNFFATNWHFILLGVAFVVIVVMLAVNGAGKAKAPKFNNGNATNTTTNGSGSNYTPEDEPTSGGNTNTGGNGGGNTGGSTNTGSNTSGGTGGTSNALLVTLGNEVYDNLQSWGSYATLTYTKLATIAKLNALTDRDLTVLDKWYQTKYDDTLKGAVGGFWCLSGCGVRDAVMIRLENI